MATTKELEVKFKKFQALKLEIEQIKIVTADACKQMQHYNKLYREGRVKIEELKDKMLEMV